VKEHRGPITLEKDNLPRLLECLVVPAYASNWAYRALKRQFKPARAVKLMEA